MGKASRRQTQLSKPAVIRLPEDENTDLIIRRKRDMRLGSVSSNLSRGDVRLSNGRIIKIKPVESESPIAIHELTRTDTKSFSVVSCNSWTLFLREREGPLSDNEPNQL